METRRMNIRSQERNPTMQAATTTVEQDLAIMNGRLGRIERGTAVLRGDISTIMHEIAEMMSDIASLKRDMEEIKGALKVPPKNGR